MSDHLFTCRYLNWFHFSLLACNILADMELITLELQPTFSISRRKAREAYLIDRGKTLSPDSLNRLFYFYCIIIYQYIIVCSIYNCS